MTMSQCSHFMWLRQFIGVRSVHHSPLYFERSVCIYTQYEIDDISLIFLLLLCTLSFRWEKKKAARKTKKEYTVWVESVITVWRNRAIAIINVFESLMKSSTCLSVSFSLSLSLSQCNDPKMLNRMWKMNAAHVIGNILNASATQKLTIWFIRHRFQHGSVIRVNMCFHFDFILFGIHIHIRIC